MKSRIRTVKPEALLDEDLWDLEHESGYPIFRAFIGLWCYADREGRFDWRPRPLGAVILPYWDGVVRCRDCGEVVEEADFSRVLDALVTRGFLVRYASGTRDDTTPGCREHGAVRTFKAHQAINGKEADSKLPDPDDCEVIPGTWERVVHACSRDPGVPVGNGNGNGREQEREGNGVRGGGHPPRAVLAPVVRQPSPTAETWAAYSAAMLDRYGVEPTRNARVNGQLANFVKRIGADDAPQVAAFYVGHADPWYGKQGHAVGLLIKDAEKLHMEWRRGRAITRGDVEAASRAGEMRAQADRVQALLGDGDDWEVA